MSRNSRTIARVCTILLYALFACLFAVPVLASSGASFSLRPERYDPAQPDTRSYFIFDATQGATLDSEVRVTNTSEETGTATLYPVDATTGHTSGVVFRLQDDPRLAAGAWVQLAETSLTLGPGESRLVPFSVTIPADARPGHHVAGIVVQGAATEQQLAEATDQNAAFEVQVTSRMAVAVQLNLPGEQGSALDVTNAHIGGADGRQQLFLQLHNTGELMTKSEGEVVVLDAAGEPLQNLSFSLNTVLPGTVIDYPLFIQDQALDVGTYRVQLRLRYGDGQILEKELPLTVSRADLTQVFAGSEPLTAPGSIAHSTANGLGAMPAVHLVALASLVTAIVLLGLLALKHKFGLHPRT